MLEIKHIRQVNDGFNWKCGAACLEMIFSHYGISKGQDEIWDAASSQRGTEEDQKFMLTCDLASYSCKAGLPATIYKADELKWAALLNELAVRRVPAILSLRQKKTGQSHFIVYKGMEANKYGFCDPDEDAESVFFDNNTMYNIWHPQPYIDVTGYILVCFGLEEDTETAICYSCGQKLPIVHPWIKGYSQAIICPHCDSFV